MTLPQHQWEQEWPTAQGRYFPGERAVVCGRDLFSELNHMSWIEFLIFGVCGYVPDKKAVRMLNAIWVLCPSYPDPRLWPIRIGTLAGVARSTGALGVHAGNAISEASVYGYATGQKATALLLEVARRHKAGETIYQIVRDIILSRPQGVRATSGKDRTPSPVSGFGRPVSTKEERLEPLLNVAKELGLTEGPIVKLAFAMEKEFLSMGLKNMFMNVGGLVSALYCDLGFSPQQQYYLSVLQHSAGIVFSSVDAVKHPEGSFFPLRCENIEYKGAAERLWSSV